MKKDKIFDKTADLISEYTITASIEFFAAFVQFYTELTS